MENEKLEKLDFFVQLYVAAHVVGLLSILLIFYWCVSFAGGFGLSGAPLFQWHPLFMSIGLIYLMGNGRSFSLVVIVLESGLWTASMLSFLWRLGRLRCNRGNAYTQTNTILKSVNL